MQIVIQKDPAAATALVARILTLEIRKNPSCVLGLATGRTMEALYELLVEEHRRRALDFSLCRTFNLDEYVGLPTEDAHSYRSYMNQHLFTRVNIDMRNTHVPDGTARDLDGECARYEALIKKYGGIDVQLLGLGRAGHIGFNEPLSALRSMTRVKALTPETIAQNSPLFEGAPVPRLAITMGVGTILEGKKLIMLVTGSEKAGILRKAVEGPITSMVTASALQLHPHCTVVVDEAGAVKLEEKDYYRWIFENDPEWAEFRV